MANHSNYVTAGKPKAIGAVYRAPKGTTLPTDAVTDLDAAFVCLGYVSDDGLTNEHATDETVKAWGGDVVMTTKTDEFGFTLIEALNTDVLKAAHGSDNVTGDLAAGVKVAVNDGNEDDTPWVVDMLLNKKTAKRIVIPKGKVTEVGEITYKDDEPIGYEITLSAGEDDDGNTHYEYFKTVTAAASEP